MVQRGFIFIKHCVIWRLRKEKNTHTHAHTHTCARAHTHTHTHIHTHTHTYTHTRTHVYTHLHAKVGYSICFRFLADQFDKDKRIEEVPHKIVRKKITYLYRILTLNVTTHCLFVCLYLCFSLCLSVCMDVGELFCQGHQSQF